MTTLIDELELRQRKIAMAIQLLKEAGLSDFQDTFFGRIEASAPVRKPGLRGPQSDEAKKRIGDRMRAVWAERKKQGMLLNPHQTPKKPLSIQEVSNE